jgi:hypothetical protein
MDYSHIDDHILVRFAEEMPIIGRNSLKPIKAVITKDETVQIFREY